jgi:predicted nucleic acid-binding protein
VRIVISDTGPVLHLREVGVLSLLEKAGEVIIPSAVAEELTARLSDWASTRPGWLRIVSATGEVAGQAEQWRAIGGLGLGEAEAVALAKSLHADWLLTDDASARIVASFIGLEVHGSLGVVLWSAAAGHLRYGEALDVLNRLAKSSLWVSPQILDEARQALEQIFR